MVRSSASLIAAGEALHAWLETTRAEPEVLSPRGYQSLRDACIRHLSHCARTLIGFTPKHHYFAELTAGSKLHGNPKCYSTWIDEGLNRSLRDAAGHAHRARQEERIFESMDLQGVLGALPHVFGSAEIIGV